GQALIEGDVPFILVGRHPTNDRVNYIDVDNRNSSRDIVTHLIRLGRRRVATIAGPKNLIAGADRLQGYYDAFRARNLTVDSDLVVEGDFSESGGYAAMQRLLLRQLDAVFVASDTMAIGALRALREAGKQVPDDIAVVSFDDMPFAARADPPLTTVRQPIIRMGAMAAETLIDIIESSDTNPRRILVPTELVMRASCGANLV
ncbi:MAG TPA: substrate-binding domain-containing protein, partial [Anaerolineales bacterium]|nr:substrate-binding domain-containing protein [Anaerolineales bacterium]